MCSDKILPQSSKSNINTIIVYSYMIAYMAKVPYVYNLNIWDNEIFQLEAMDCITRPSIKSKETQTKPNQINKQKLEP
jgi:nicotinamide mononucleotide adenylyltransferase